MDTPANQPTSNQPVPSVVNLQAQSPMVVNAETAVPPPPGKNSKLLLMLLVIFAILGVSAASYFLIWNKPKAVAPAETARMEEKTDAMMENKASDSAEMVDAPAISTSDSIDAIEQDLDTTTVSDDSSLYTDIETDLNNL